MMAQIGSYSQHTGSFHWYLSYIGSHCWTSKAIIPGCYSITSSMQKWDFKNRYCNTSLFTDCVDESDILTKKLIICNYLVDSQTFMASNKWIGKPLWGDAWLISQSHCWNRWGSGVFWLGLKYIASCMLFIHNPSKNVHYALYTSHLNACVLYLVVTYSILLAIYKCKCKFRLQTNLICSKPDGEAILHLAVACII